MISILGNIACGKSTLLRNLKKKGFQVLEEPVSDWRFLPKFYESPERWCFALQVEVLHSYAKMGTSASNQIVERSAYEATNIFALNAYNNGQLTKEEYELISDISEVQKFPDQFVYIASTPELCHARLKTRNRDCEANVPLSYLKDLHLLYETTVKQIRDKDIPFTVINGDCTEEEMLKDFMITHPPIQYLASHGFR